jgi:hypothetical protein
MSSSIVGGHVVLSQKDMLCLEPHINVVFFFSEPGILRCALL